MSASGNFSKHIKQLASKCGQIMGIYFELLNLEKLSHYWYFARPYCCQELTTAQCSVLSRLWSPHKSSELNSLKNCSALLLVGCKHLDYWKRLTNQKLYFIVRKLKDTKSYIQDNPRPQHPLWGSPFTCWVKSEQVGLKGTIFRFYILNLRPQAKICFFTDDFS